MVVGLLGVLKAGTAYVPLDPGYPAERLAFMVEDSGAALLLADTTSLAVLPEPRVPVVQLEAPDAGTSEAEELNPRSLAAGDGLAYVIYTSGSTGRPKGATITHRAICNHMLWMQAAFPLTEADRVLQKTP